MLSNLESTTSKVGKNIWQGVKRITGAEAYEWTWCQKNSLKHPPLKVFGVGLILGGAELLLPATIRSMRYSKEASNFHDRFRYESAYMNGLIIDSLCLIFLTYFIDADLPPTAFLATKALTNIATDLFYRKIIIAGE